MLNFRLAFSALILVFISQNLIAQDDFQLGEYSPKRGERTDLVFDVPTGKDDPATIIPVSVIRGLKDGPTALIVAGVHGYEFPPILAADRLVREIKPTELEGTVIIVRIAHIPAYENRVPFVNPFDRKNLNRSFPGSPNGTQTERIAHVLSSIIIPAADFVFDIHSGDGAEFLEAFIGVYGGPFASDYQAAIGVARAMGFPNIVRYKMNTQKQIDHRRSLYRQAVAQGLPTVLVEVGQNGSRKPEEVELIVDGLRNSLTFLGILPGKINSNDIEPRYFESTTSVKAQSGGIWNPNRHAGPVKEGEVLGIIRSYSGSSEETVISPVSGYAIYGLNGPPVQAGNSLFTIAKPVKSLD